MLPRPKRLESVTTLLTLTNATGTAPHRSGVGQQLMAAVRVMARCSLVRCLTCESPI